MPERIEEWCFARKSKAPDPKKHSNSHSLDSKFKEEEDDHNSNAINVLLSARGSCMSVAQQQSIYKYVKR